MEELYNKLVEFSKEDYYPMHMPGHKRNTLLCRMENPYEIDITEIEGFDNLHQPEGILRSLSERLARIYGSLKAYPLVNGSTSGILSAMMAATNRGDKVLLARNSHKSIYHGVILSGLIPLYIYPQKITGITPVGGILPLEIEEVLITHKEIKLVILTSPTYEGVVSDIKTIAEIVHKHGAYLMVDEAHGAHFGFHKELPESAVRLGADLVIQSLHKTLPAFTQTAVLHSNCSELNPRIEKYLAVHQSSSPSYVLLAGIDRCISMLEEKHQELFETYLTRLDNLYLALKPMKHLRLLSQELVGNPGVYALDPSKLTITIKNGIMSGHALAEQLYQKYHLVMEMAAADYILGMTSICDTEEGFTRFVNALLEIDQELEEEAVRCESEEELPPRNGFLIEPKPQEMTMLPCEAWGKSSEIIEFTSSVGRCSASFVSLFPPGQPILVPGETIRKELIEYIVMMKQQGITITGLSGTELDRIEVICETERIS